MDLPYHSEKAVAAVSGRRVTVRYPDGFTETLPSFNNVRRVQNTKSVILVGSTVERTLAINPGTLANNPSRCGGSCSE